MAEIGSTFSLRVKSISFEAEGIRSFDLRTPDGTDLPPFQPGAHIDLHLAGRIIRSYSLVNSADERHRYVVGVALDPSSRGGSSHMFEKVSVGDILTVSPPSNDFPLVEDASHSVMIAGGIGITPIWCMIQRLEALGRSWELHYATRTRDLCAFRSELETLERRQSGRVNFVFDREPGAQMLDLTRLAAATARDAHLYCCGPTPMLAAFEDATKARAPETVHREYFAAAEAPAADGGFTVELARAGSSHFVQPGHTILDTLIDAGLEVSYACMNGVCGTCETAVIEGKPDHRDSLLSEAERASGRTMMICCSGSLSDRLILDL
jgi:ferredoxin-NADP reductase